MSPAKEQGDGRLRIAGATLTGVFRIDGTVEWFGGTITGPGTTTVAPGGTLLLTSSAFNIAATLDGGHRLLNQGTVDWSATGGMEMGTGAVFTNADGGRFDITGGQGNISDAGTPDPRIENLPGGIVTRSGTSVATIGVPFSL